MSIETLEQSAAGSDGNVAARQNNAGAGAVDNQQTQDNKTADISDELKEQIIADAIESGRVVDYETRFKPIYGSLKHTERELAEIRKGSSAASGHAGSSPDKDPVKPKPDDFESYDDYVEALTDYKTEIKIRDFSNKQKQQAHTAKTQETINKKWDEQLTKAIAKDPDYVEKAYIPMAMIELLQDTEHLADFGYYFARNPAEAQRIMAMSTVQAAREIIKLENQFKEPPAKTQTKAPANTKGLDGTTIISKDPKDMTMAEYEAWRATGGK